jgi:pyridoxamine 5'-phosphate oxidase
MTKRELVSKINDLIEDARCAVLASITSENEPRIRWMTPTFLPGEDRMMYAITNPESNKIHDMENNENVSWMFQMKDLSEIVNVRGKMNIIDNPSLKAEIIELIGARIHIIWRLNPESDFIVLETVIEEGIYFNPMRSVCETVKF